MSLPSAAAAPAAVVGKALVRAAAALGLSQSDVARVLGSSPASVSRTFAGLRGLDPGSAEGRNALLLVRVFRSLDPLVGGDSAKARLWLHAKNRHLGEVPARLLTTTQGLVHVADYLDAMRGTL
ncbi:MAG: antitoxin Xre/MbcA/ParS toxin-binding domain-containing protein [Myxococcales bacterium]